LKAESRVSQLEDIQLKLKKELNACEEKIDLEIFTGKKLNHEIEELNASI
jgi:hypothetical protein